MPLHDWTQVEAGIFHDFHTAWISEIRKELNGGLLPAGYYALAEQHAGRYVADILTLHARPDTVKEQPLPPPPTLETGGTAVAEAPPKVGLIELLESELVDLQRTLTIRHISTHRVIALLEIVSPANKDRGEHMEEFAIKTITALERGVHVLVVDLFPPGAYDPNGIHGEIRQRLVPLDEPFELPRDEPQTLVSYVAGSPTKVYLNQISVGDAIPEMPLFLTRERYVNAPLEATYNAAYEGMPKFWRDVLEGRID
ncbi:MAG: DUF4058 family protein [Planctomycetota bacterium]|nr:DUF4058 family protein [Planctomycetota bacterium]